MPLKTQAYTALQAIRARKAQIEEESLNDRGLDSGGQYQDADAAQIADPVNKRKAAMSQMDSSAGADNPSQGGSGGSPLESMPGQQGGKDALAASNKTSAEGAKAVAAIEAMAGGPTARPVFVQSNNPYAASQMPLAGARPQSNLFKRKFNRF